MKCCSQSAVFLIGTDLRFEDCPHSLDGSVLFLVHARQVHWNRVIVHFSEPWQLVLAKLGHQAISLGLFTVVHRRLPASLDQFLAPFTPDSCQIWLTTSLLKATASPLSSTCRKPSATCSRRGSGVYGVVGFSDFSSPHKNSLRLLRASSALGSFSHREAVRLLKKGHP